MADLDDARTNDDGKTIDMDDAGGASNLANTPAKRISELDDATQFRVLKSNWEADRTHSAIWRIQCGDDFGFRAGEQLTEEDKALLNAQQRPHIVFNRVLTILKAVAGMEINGRHEIQYLPRNNEDTAPNEVLSAASKWMGDGCDAEDEESQAFDDCSTCGMGWWEMRWSHFKDRQGAYIEEQIDPREMYWDRTAKKKNLSDSRRMHRVRKMPLGDAMRMFPGKTRQELNAAWAEGFSDQGETQSIEQKRVREENTTDATYDDTNEVTIVHTQWWEDEPFWLVADPDNGEMHEVTTKEYRILALQMGRLGMKLDAEKMSRQVFKQAFLGAVMLQSARPAPIQGQFSWVCITGEIDKVKGTYFGLIKVMRDPQMWANRFLSQTMQIMNTTAKGGILAETDAFDDQRQAEDSYAQPEAISWVASGALSGQKPKIIPKPGQGMADGYVNLMQFAITSIKDVTGINMELLGLQDQNQPGILEAQRKQAGMTILATLFDSLRRARKITGRGRLDIIQRKMSDGRLIRVVGNESTQAVRLVKEKTFGEYDVIVDDAPTSPNQKEANWAIIQPLLVVFKDQLMANPTVIAQVLEYSPLPSKLVDLIKQMALQAQNDPKAQQMKEIMQQLQLRGLAAKVHKDDSAGTLNEAKAIEAHAGGIYSEAMAKNMLEDNQNAGMKQLFDAIDSYAKVKNADSKAELTAAQAKREHIGAARDILDMHHRHSEATHGAGTALTAMARDIAGARKDHATADLTERTPAPLPMDTNANAGA